MKKTKIFMTLVLAVIILNIGITAVAAENVMGSGNANTQNEIQPRSGCGNWSKTYGTPYCSNQLCPGGFKRRLRNVNYYRLCVRDNNTTYPETYSDIEFVACDCH